MTLSFFTSKKFTKEQIDSFVSRISLYVGKPSYVYTHDEIKLVSIEISSNVLDYNCLQRIKSVLTYIFDEDINFMIQ